MSQIIENAQIKYDDNITDANGLVIGKINSIDHDNHIVHAQIFDSNTIDMLKNGFENGRYTFGVKGIAEKYNNGRINKIYWESVQLIDNKEN